MNLEKSETCGMKENEPENQHPASPKSKLFQVKHDKLAYQSNHDGFFDIKPKFNPSAQPFLPPRKNNYEIFPVINVGPSKVPVNAKVWDRIAHNRILPTLPLGLQSSKPTLSTDQILQPPPLFNSLNFYDNFVSFFSHL